MRRSLTLTACLSLSALLASAAKADPIVVTAYLTIGPDQYIGNQTWSATTTIANPSDPNLGTIWDSNGVYDPVQLTIPPSSIPPLTSGGTFSSPVGPIHDIQTTYDLKLYFGPSTVSNVGSQQTNPYVEITGTISGFILDGRNGTELSLSPSTMSLSLNNDTSSSSIPPGMLKLISNPSNYLIWTAGMPTDPPGLTTEVLVQVAYDANPVPEPTTWLIFLTAAIGGGALRLRERSRRRSLSTPCVEQPSS